MAIEDVQTNLRIPSNIKERLQASADFAGRSLSAEAAYRLNQAFELEMAQAQTAANVHAARHEVQRAHAEVEQVRIRESEKDRTIAVLEERLKTITEARQTDIEAATRDLEKRVDFLAEKAAFAQREADSARAAQQALATLNKVVGNYLAIVAGMVEKTSPEGKRLMQLIKDIGQALHEDNFAVAVAAAAEITNLAEEHKLLALADKSTHTPEKVARQLKKKPGLLD